jgi:hypothetical protein
VRFVSGLMLSAFIHICIYSLTRVGIGIGKATTLAKGTGTAMTVTTVPGKGVTIDTTVSVDNYHQSCSILSWQLILEIM